MATYAGFDPGVFQPWALNLLQNSFGTPGIVRGMQVQQTATPSMNVNVSVDPAALDGVCWLPNGCWARIDAALALSVPSNATGATRQDAVVVTVDPSGTPAPSIAYVTAWNGGFANAATNQLVLALINVPNGAAAIYGNNIVPNVAKANIGANVVTEANSALADESRDATPSDVFTAYGIIVATSAAANQTSFTIPLTTMQRLVPMGRIGGADELGYFAGPRGWYMPRLYGSVSGALMAASVDPAAGTITTAVGAQAGESVTASYKYYDFSQDLKVWGGVQMLIPRDPHLVYQMDVAPGRAYLTDDVWNAVSRSVQLRGSSAAVLATFYGSGFGPYTASNSASNGYDIVVDDVYLPALTLSNYPNQYFVSPSGNDVTGTGTSAAPWATVQKAMSKVGAATWIRVLPGTYTMSTQVYSHAGGAANSPCLIRSETLYGAKLSSTYAGAIVYNDGNYTIWQGFDVSDPTNQTAKLGIEDASYQGSVIINNYVHNLCTLQANSGYGGTGIETANYSGVGAKILGNISINNGTTLTLDNQNHGIYVTANSTLVANNIVGYNAGYGIHLYHFAYSDLILNNLVFANNYGGILVGASNNTNNFTIVANNIIRDHTGSGGTYGIREFPSTGPNNLYLNNILWNNASAIITITTGSAGIAGNIYADPQMPNFPTNLTQGFQVLPTSPAINAGVGNATVPLYLIATDFSTYVRTNGPNVDIGPFQWGSGEYSSQYSPDLGPLGYLGLQSMAQGVGIHTAQLTFANSNAEFGGVQVVGFPTSSLNADGGQGFLNGALVTAVAISTALVGGVNGIAGVVSLVLPGNITAQLSPQLTPGTFDEELLARVPIAKALQYGGVTNATTWYGTFDAPTMPEAQPVTVMLGAGSTSPLIGQALSHGWKLTADPYSPYGAYVTTTRIGDGFSVMGFGTGMDVLYYAANPVTANVILDDNSSYSLTFPATNGAVRGKASLFAGATMGTHRVHLALAKASAGFGLDAVDILGPSLPAMPAATTPLATLYLLGNSAQQRLGLLRNVQHNLPPGTAQFVSSPYFRTIGPAIALAGTSTNQQLVIPTFTSGAVRALYLTTGSSGQFTITVDTSTYATIDTYAATTTVTQTPWYSVGQGFHSVQLAPTGLKNTSSSGFTDYLLGLDILPHPVTLLDTRKPTNDGVHPVVRTSSIVDSGGRLANEISANGIGASQLLDRAVTSRKLAPIWNQVIATTAFSGFSGAAWPTSVSDPALTLSVVVEVPSVVLVSLNAYPKLNTTVGGQGYILLDGVPQSQTFTISNQAGTTAALPLVQTIFLTVGPGMHTLSYVLGQYGSTLAAPYYDGTSERSLSVLAFAL